MSEKINQIVEDLKTLTLLEASQLITKIEETFNVDASASVGGAMVMATASSAEEVEEKTEFDLILDEVPADKKIPVLFMTDAVDEFWLQNIGKYKEFEFKSITKGKVDLSKVGEKQSKEKSKNNKGNIRGT